MVIGISASNKDANYYSEDLFRSIKFDRQWIFPDDSGILVEMRRLLLYTCLLLVMVAASCGEKHPAGKKKPPPCDCPHFSAQYTVRSAQC